MSKPMKKVGRDASVHHKTVSNLPTLDENKIRLKNPYPNGPVTVTQMHEEVWAKALELAGGDASRIERISESDVIIHNHSGWKK